MKCCRGGRRRSRGTVRSVSVKRETRHVISWCGLTELPNISSSFSLLPPLHLLASLPQRNTKNFSLITGHLFRPFWYCLIRTPVQIFTARKRSCGKVMFLQLSVILFTGEGGVFQHAIGKAVYTPLARQPRQGRHPPPPKTATAMGSTHPTAMHSCYLNYDFHHQKGTINWRIFFSF